MRSKCNRSTDSSRTDVRASQFIHDPEMNDTAFKCATKRSIPRISTLDVDLAPLRSLHTMQRRCYDMRFVIPSYVLILSLSLSDVFVCVCVRESFAVGESTRKQAPLSITYKLCQRNSRATQHVIDNWVASFKLEYLKHLPVICISLKFYSYI